MSITTIVAAAGRRAVSRTARDVAVEHAGTKQQRLAAKQSVREALGDSPVNVGGAAESTVLGFFGL